jgi:two-component system, OmpR family, response regulator RegX3
MQHLTQFKVRQQPIKVLVITEQTELYEKLSATLNKAGYELERLDEKNTMLIQVSLQLWDLILIGPLAFGDSGIALCVELRRRTLTPIVLFVDTYQTSILVQAFEAGADRVIKLPFQGEELIARITALLRRTSLAQPNEKNNQTFSVGAIDLNDDTYIVKIENRAVALSSLEYRLLRYLMKQPDRFVSKGELLREVWESKTEEPSNSVEVVIHRLRSKIEADATAPKYLITRYGIGYKLIQSR